MGVYILGLHEIDKTSLVIAGGKCANLGELSRIEGIRVPEGFCVTTDVYKKVIERDEGFNALLDQLAIIKADDRNAIGEVCANIRAIIENISIPPDIADEISGYLAKYGEGDAYAIRSSATAEDLPAASFAGQQDTYLNIIGEDAILNHISKCWASLYTERAAIYRIRNGFDHRKVHLSVIIQKMIFSQAAGIIFTADPISGNRKTLSIDAGFGLGEAMVSGLVNADNYKVCSGKIAGKKVFTKKRAIYALKDGGTKEQEIAREQADKQVLTDEQILELESTGRKIESHLGYPQDIEWCLAGGTFYIVQSRPITTLYPIPERADEENHVYVSVGHQQMMTDAMKPLGIAMWRLKAVRPMYEAGRRLFIDVAKNLASPAGRKTIIDLMGEHDPLIKDALIAIAERGFITLLPDDNKEPDTIKSSTGKSFADIQAQIKNDPAIVQALIRRSEASIAALKQDILGKSGSDLFDFIVEDIRQANKTLFDAQNLNAIVAGIDASSWINRKMKEWLGETNVADTLSQSVSNNITSEMGLALLDVADAVRPYPEVIAYLQHTENDNFLDELVNFEGGQEIQNTINIFFSKHGMRCAGEIDITKPRWSEKPITLVPIILSNIKNFGPGAAIRKFEQGLKSAFEKEQWLLDRLKQLPDGEKKAWETKQMIDLLRTFIGYREYPKYGIVSRSWVYKQALLQEAERLVQANVIHEKEDIYYLTFEELHEVVRTNKQDYQLINKRKDEYKFYKKLTPPRVITSDGEIVSGEYKHENLPAAAIAGLAVSSGIVEGRARIILKMEDANIEEGDILITPFTDPSWTPLFVSIKGLVTEVGGLMTHGAVIAREYGLPAVVGVKQATQLIKDGQRIRVNGTEGYVEIL